MSIIDINTFQILIFQERCVYIWPGEAILCPYRMEVDNNDEVFFYSTVLGWSHEEIASPHCPRPCQYRDKTETLKMWSQVRTPARDRTTTLAVGPPWLGKEAPGHLQTVDILISEYSRVSPGSLIYMLKRVGLKLHPCHTPQP